MSDDGAKKMRQRGVGNHFTLLSDDGDDADTGVDDRACAKRQLSDIEMVPLTTDPDDSRQSPTPLPPPSPSRCRARSGGRGMRRFASVDFVRGLAVVIMLVLHVISDILDIPRYLDNIGSVPLINVVALLALPFYGGLAGLFLLTSAVSNGISARRAVVDRGHTPLAVATKQIVGGALLVAVAMTAEAFLGYHGAWGEVLHHLHELGGVVRGEIRIVWWRYNAFVFETLHAIGWCTLVNGAVHGLLMRRFYGAQPPRGRDAVPSSDDLVPPTTCDGRRGSTRSDDARGSIASSSTEEAAATHYSPADRIVFHYWILMAAVLILTPCVWAVVGWAIPGYPWEINESTGHPMPMATTGKSPWYDFVLYFFVNPLAAPVEPIFPYLATAFLGTIIGHKLCDSSSSSECGETTVVAPGREVNNFVPRFLRIGAAMLVTGLSGLAVLLARLDDADTAIEVYLNIWNHRYYDAEHGMGPLGWLFQYLALNGFSLLAMLAMVRLVECRGEEAAKAFGDSPAATFVRRFGFVALTVYTIQWVYAIIQFVVTAAWPGVDYYGRLPWSGTHIVVALTLVSLHGIMLAWERVGYIGSMEWIIISLANRLVPGVKKQVGVSAVTSATGEGQRQRQLRWWERGRLNVALAFYHPEWIAFPAEQQTQKHLQDDIMLVRRLSIAGFFFSPLSFIAYGIIRSLQRGENGVAKDSIKVWLRASKAGMLFFFVWVSALSVISLEDLGIRI